MTIILSDQYRLPLAAATATRVRAADESARVYTISDMTRNDKRCCSDRIVTLYHLYDTA
jgi:hypothetical protein